MKRYYAVVAAHESEARTWLFKDDEPSNAKLVHTEQGTEPGELRVYVFQDEVVERLSDHFNLPHLPDGPLDFLN